MSVIKKFCEIEEGLILGEVSIDADTGEIITTGHLRVHSFNLNDNFVVSSIGNAVLDGTLLVNSKTTLHSLEVDNQTVLNDTLTVNEDVHFIKDLTLSGGDLKTTNATFNLLNSTVQTINFGGTASQINIGKSGDHWVKTNSNLEVTRNLTVGYQFEVAEGKFQFDGVYGDQGATRLQGILEVGQDVTLESGLEVQGSTSLYYTYIDKILSDLNVNDNFVVSNLTGDTDISGNTSITGTLGVVAAVDFDSTLNVDGNTTVGGTLSITGNSTFSGTINGTSFTTADDELTISNKINTSKVTTSDVVLPNARLTAKTLTLGAWTVSEDPNGDGSILFKYNGTTVMSLGSNGALTTAHDITAWGTPV